MVLGEERKSASLREFNVFLLHTWTNTTLTAIAAYFLDFK